MTSESVLKGMIRLVLTAVPLVSVVGDGFFGSSEKLLPSRPEALHSFFSVAVGADVSMLLSESLVQPGQTTQTVVSSDIRHVNPVSISHTSP